MGFFRRNLCFSFLGLTIQGWYLYFTQTGDLTCEVNHHIRLVRGRNRAPPYWITTNLMQIKLHIIFIVTA